MRKKDYELIASLLSQWGYVKKHREDWVALCQLFASGLEATYPKFDRQKFLTACGIETAEDSRAKVLNGLAEIQHQDYMDSRH